MKRNNFKLLSKILLDFRASASFAFHLSDCLFHLILFPMFFGKWLTYPCFSICFIFAQVFYNSSLCDYIVHSNRHYHSCISECWFYNKILSTYYLIQVQISEIILMRNNLYHHSCSNGCLKVTLQHVSLILWLMTINFFQLCNH